VYGMPKAAVELQAAAKILPVDEIANVLITFVTLPTSKLMEKQYE
jgi:chemotaxis response regulator CheB